MGGTLTYRSRACSLSLSLGLLDGLVRKLSWACSPARCARRFGLCMSENRAGRNQWGSREYRRTSWLVHRGTRAPPLEPLAELACTRLLESVRATLSPMRVVRRLSICDSSASRVALRALYRSVACASCSTPRRRAGLVARSMLGCSCIQWRKRGEKAVASVS